MNFFISNDGGIIINLEHVVSCELCMPEPNSSNKDPKDPCAYNPRTMITENTLMVYVLNREYAIRLYDEDIENFISIIKNNSNIPPKL